MPFKDIRFPTSISAQTDGGPGFRTQVSVSRNGRSERFRTISDDVRKFNVASGLKSKDDFVQFLAFFRVVGGMADTFRYKDWLDFEIEPTTGLTDELTTTTFQIRKQYVYGSETVHKTITKPVSGSLTVFEADGTTVVDPGDYTVSYTTGVVTFSIAPGFVPRVECEYDLQMRFDSDDFVGNAEDFARSANLVVIEDDC